MSNIDWSKAPEWATVLLKHLYCTSTAWASSHADGAKAESIDPGGMTFELVSRAWHVVANRPSPAWSGEGLPPAGVVCEISKLDGCNTWIKAEILFITKSCVVFKADMEEKALYTYELKFRQIRTPEQIAADELASAFHMAICDVEEKVAKWNTTIDCTAAIKATVDVMIRLGYRKS